MSRTALVLSGGGSRGAYQVGVLKAIHEMSGVQNTRCPFQVLVGASAGALNTAQLAAYHDDFAKAIRGLHDMWSTITFEQVFRTDIRSLGTIGMKWMKDLSFGATQDTADHSSRALLDTTPLKNLLTRALPMQRIKRHIDSGELYAYTVSAINLYTSNTVNFIQGPHDTKMWNKMMRLSELSTITVDHIMASSAIPIIFPSIEVENRHFGDGCVRNTTPISPAIHLGADKIIAVGVRHYTEVKEDSGKHLAPPSVAQISSVILNSVLLDALELDVGRIHRINRLTANGETTDGEQVFKPVQVCLISPSEDLGKISAEYSERLPRVIRYLLKGLGADAPSTDMISYLMFEPDFCNRLIDLGYRDAYKQKEEILSILHSN